MRKILIAGLACTLLLASCRPGRIDLGPPLSRLERIEGYASLRIKGEQGSARSKFSFYFHLPQQGWIQVSSFLGKTIYRILIDNGEAFFIVPSKKVYWRGEEEEIIDKFLGFRLSLEEMTGLLSGRWEMEEPGMKGWIFERDEGGRICAGRKADFRFEVREFFCTSPFARHIAFFHPSSEGQLKVLSVGVNPPPKKSVFSKEFLESCEQKSWLEIEEMIENAH